MRKLIYTILALVICGVSFGQMSVSFYSGYGSFRMNEMKSYIASYVRAYPEPVTPETTSSFPAFWNYGLQVVYPNGKWQFGGALSFGSTGSRSSYSDRTGSIRIDMLTSYTMVQVVLARNLYVGNHWRLAVDLKPGFSYGKMSFTEDRRITGSNLNTNFNDSYTSNNFSFQPTLIISRAIGMFELSAFAGSQADVWKGVLIEQSSRYSSASKQMKLDWSGYRMGASITMNIKNTKEREGENAEMFVGVGSGVDYGGLVGAQFSLVAFNRVGFFGGVGYNLNDISGSAGTRVALFTDVNVRPYITAMYGYNAVVKVKNAPQYDRTFYGPSAGIGVDIGRHERPVSIGLLVPFRKPEFNNYINQLKSAGVTFDRMPWPVMTSIGYKFAIPR